MPNKKLTQTGLNRAMWIMLHKLEGKIIIPEGLLEKPNVEDAIQIQYDPSIKSFIFSLHKVRENQTSVILQPGMLN